jgi:hypothetical protein
VAHWQGGSHRAPLLNLHLYSVLQNLTHRRPHHKSPLQRSTAYPRIPLSRLPSAVPDFLPWSKGEKSLVPDRVSQATTRRKATTFLAQLAVASSTPYSSLLGTVSSHHLRPHNSQIVYGSGTGHITARHFSFQSLSLPSRSTVIRNTSTYPSPRAGLRDCQRRFRAWRGLHWCLT